ncbi:MAG TPA: hypothetical protein VJ385_18655 [Fibrobacteria bacterium]|nr:hypothetical protein [Fibrobacteria bacterium]
MPGMSGKYLLFSVDTEPDDAHWRGLSKSSWTHENLRGLPGLIDRLRDLDLRATYLVSHSVAETGRLEDILGQDLAAGRCEVGAHFHPGDTPPFGKAGAKAGDNLLKVPDGLLEEKFGNLHATLARRFGKPESYRSGAWALDRRLIALLGKYGYKADSSVTPGVSWRVNGRPSYLTAPMRAYPLGAADPCIPGDTGILEVPVSIWSPRRWDGTLMGRLLGSVLTMPLGANKGPAARVVRRLRPGAPKWLRPAFKTLPEMEATAARLEADGAGYLHVMCHSNELWPGTSPYCANRSDLDGIHARLEGIFRWALDRGYMPVTMERFAGIHAAALGLASGV